MKNTAAESWNDQTQQQGTDKDKTENISKRQSCKDKQYVLKPWKITSGPFDRITWSSSAVVIDQ